MNYEDRTYEAILKEMLDRVSSTLDKREGSVIYDALAPAAAELAQAYIHMEYELADVFLATGSEQTLTQKGEELGLHRHGATAAEGRGRFNIEVPMGSRFNLDDLNFQVVESLGQSVDAPGTWEARLLCETPGTTGNRTGTLIPIQYINGLTSAELLDILTEGEDQEDVEHYRSRLLEYVQRPITSGNKYHYEAWAKEVAGVGASRCQPLWNGPGTVRVLVTDSQMQAADEGLCRQVAEHIEEVRPIGATVTVAPPVARTIDVAAKITLAPGTYLETVRQRLTAAVTEHLASLVFARTYVSLALIGSLILETPGVADYEELTLSGSVANIRIAENEIPVLGSLEVSV